LHHGMRLTQASLYSKARQGSAGVTLAIWNLREPKARPYFFRE
jgi:hypothetical protein